MAARKQKVLHRLDNIDFRVQKKCSFRVWVCHSTARFLLGQVLQKDYLHTAYPIHLLHGDKPSIHCKLNKCGRAWIRRESYHENIPFSCNSNLVDLPNLLRSLPSQRNSQSKKVFDQHFQLVRLRASDLDPSLVHQQLYWRTTHFSLESSVHWSNCRIQHCGKDVWLAENFW